jgi:hypothetical protein
MKSRTMIALLTCAAAASAGACSGESGKAVDEPTAVTSEQNLIAATGNVMMWPAGPLAWNGLVGTWPIAIWSPAAIGAIAFDVAGMASFGVTVAGFANLNAVAITTPFLNAFGFGAAAVTPFVGAPFVGAPFVGAAGLFAPAFGFAGAFNPWVGTGLNWGLGAFAPGVAAFQGSFVNGAITAGWAPWLTPTLTTSAMMFTSLAAIDMVTPYIFNLSFTAASAAQAAAVTQAAAVSSAAAFTMAGLSIFATPIMSTALVAGTAIPFSSMIYPFIPPILPVVTTVPVVAAPIVPAPVIVAPVL